MTAFRPRSTRLYGRRLLLCVVAMLALVALPSDRLPVHAAAAPGGSDLTRLELTALVDIELARAWVEAQGADVEVESRNRLQVLVTPETALAVYEADDIVRVERPGIWVPTQTASTSATEQIGAERWHHAGYTGHDVSIAVLDSGFAGYQSALGTTLPPASRVETRSFRADGGIGGTDHGRRAAEIVHRVAPGARLHLVNFSTITELSAAVDYLIEQDVTAVSFSLGYIHNGPGDGTGPVNEIVSRATSAGLAWVAASGNWAQQHWSGPFRDNAGDSLHEFEPGVTRNGHFFQAGDLITVSLRWDDTWGAACSDYDLELFGPDGSLVRASRTIQNCDSDPVESLQVLATQTGTYHVRIIEAHAERSHNLSLMVVGSPDRGHPLMYSTPQGSLSEPADHPDVITVGTISGETQTEAAYSSRGPTLDGRVKPNIVSPTGLTGNGRQTFAGTSAAAPHVAGVLALFQEAFPSADRHVLATMLQTRSVPLHAAEGGTPGLRRVDTGTVAGTGPLLPAGALEAVVLGELPPAPGLALIAYRGPDGYPMRFLHLLVDGRSVEAAFTHSTADGWRTFIRGAPPWVNRLATLDDGDALILRLGAA